MPFALERDLTKYKNAEKTIKGSKQADFMKILIGVTGSVATIKIKEIIEKLQVFSLISGSSSSTVADCQEFPLF